MSINDLVKQACLVNYPILCPIEEFSIEDLLSLSEDASLNNVEVKIRTEHSGIYKGTLIHIEKKWDI